MYEDTNFIISMELARNLLDNYNIKGVPMDIRRVHNTNNISVTYSNALGEFKVLFDGETGKMIST